MYFIIGITLSVLAYVALFHLNSYYTLQKFVELDLIVCGLEPKIRELDSLSAQRHLAIDLFEARCLFGSLQAARKKAWTSFIYDHFSKSRKSLQRGMNIAQELTSLLETLPNVSSIDANL